MTFKCWSRLSSVAVRREEISLERERAEREKRTAEQSNQESVVSRAHR